MVTALVDSDTPIFSAALSAEDSESWVATSRLDKIIEGILESVKCSDYKLFVSAPNNFRKSIYPEYKANRTQPPPKWREVCKQHLIEKWGAIEVNSLEADDLCGIYQSDDTIICGIDKDLLQIPGRHYSWDIVRKGVVVTPSKFQEVSPLEGLRSFYKQMLIGDTSDNIIGIDGIGKVKAAKLIDHLHNEENMYAAVQLCYEMEYPFCSKTAHANMKRNADLLWIMRDLGETYTTRMEVM